MDHQAIEKLYGHFFVPIIDEDEYLVDAIPAISELVAERVRSERDGTLGLTNRRLLFVSMTGRPWHLYGHLAIRSAEAGRILIPPGNSWLIIHLEEGHSARFMVGKKQISSFLPELEAAVTKARKAHGST